MSLPTLADAKAYLRIQTGTAEDAALVDMLLDAQALVETYIGVPIAAVSDSMVDDTLLAVRFYARPRRLLCKRFPVAPASVVIVDSNNVTVDPTTYTVDGRTGIIRANAGVSFDAGPYTITATAGLSAHPDYTNRFERIVRRAILDVVADLYQRRNPAARTESDGGAMVLWGPEGLAPRVMAMLAPLRVSVQV